MQQHLAALAVDFEFAQGHVHGGAVIPVVAGHGLVVPLHAAAVRIDGDDGGEEQVIAAAGRADRARPRRAVADADVEAAQLFVVNERVPSGATAAVAPPFAAPSFGGEFHFRMLERLLWVSGRQVEAPDHGAGRRVVSSDITPPPSALGTALADEHLVRRDAGRTGDVEAPQRRRMPSIDLPNHGAVGGIEGEQAAIVGGHVDAPLVDGDAAVGDAPAAGIANELAVGLGVEPPKLGAGAGIQREHHTPAVGGIHHAIDDEGCALHSFAVVADLLVPSEAQAPHRLPIDLRQRRETVFLVGAPVGEPIARLGAGGGADALVVHGDRLAAGCVRVNAGTRAPTDERGQRERPPSLSAHDASPVTPPSGQYATSATVAQGRAGQGPSLCPAAVDLTRLVAR